MRQIAILIAIAWPALGLAQAPYENPRPAPAVQAPTPLPEAPAPAPAPGSAMWDRIEHLPRGEKIKVDYGHGPQDRCRFAGATDQYLFCEPGEDSDRPQEYRIDRFSVTDFKIDHDERNGRLIFASVILGSGIALGIRCAQSQVYPSDAQAAGTICGLLGAGLGTLAAMPLSCISGHCVTLHLPPPQPIAYGIGYNVPLRIPMHRR